MKIGCSTIAWVLLCKSTTEVLGVKTADTIEWVWDMGQVPTPADRNKATLHGPFYYTNVAALEDAAHSMTVQSITQALQIGLPTVVHEGRPVTSFDDWWQRGKVQQEHTLDCLADSGIVQLENVSGWSYCPHLLDVFALARPLATNGVRVCLDLAHVWIKEGSLDPVLRLSDADLSLIGKVHVSDCTTGHDAHLPIGSGELPLQQVAPLLRDLNVPVIDEAIPRTPCDIAAFFEVELEHLRKLLCV